MFHSNVAALLWISNGEKKPAGENVTKSLPFKGKNISSETESYAVIIQKLH